MAFPIWTDLFACWASPVQIWRGGRPATSCGRVLGVRCLAALGRHGGDLLEELAGSWVWAGEAAGESRTPAAAGAVDGGAYGLRPLVGGIDVAVLSFPCSTCFRGNPRSGLPGRMMTTPLAMPGIVFPLEDIVLELDSVRGTKCSWRWLATAYVTSP